MKQLCEVRWSLCLPNKSQHIIRNPTTVYWSNLLPPLSKPKFLRIVPHILSSLSRTLQLPLKFNEIVKFERISKYLNAVLQLSCYADLGSFKSIVYSKKGRLDPWISITFFHQMRADGCSMHFLSFFSHICDRSSLELYKIHTEQ